MRVGRPLEESDDLRLASRVDQTDPVSAPAREGNAACHRSMHQTRSRSIVTLKVNVSRRQLRDLDLIAQEFGMSRSWIVREALRIGVPAAIGRLQVVAGGRVPGERPGDQSPCRWAQAGTALRWPGARTGGCIDRTWSPKDRRLPRSTMTKNRQRAACWVNRLPRSARLSGWGESATRRPFGTGPHRAMLPSSRRRGRIRTKPMGVLDRGRCRAGGTPMRGSGRDR